MARGKRRRLVPQLESIEERVVPSAVSLSPSATAEIRRFGHRVNHTARNVQNYFTSLYQNRPGHAPNLSWNGHRVPPTQTSNGGLFGISWLKF